jgi:carboxyl-terminal processing protease
VVGINSERKSNNMKFNLKNLFIIFFIVFNFLTLSSKSEEDIYKKIDLFSEVLNKINKQYVDDVNQSEMMDAAINGVLQSLDPYSAYMSPEMFKNMATETSGEFGGLGIEVGMEAGVVKVISPIDNSPAYRVGVKAGDYIVKINEIQVQGKSLTEAVELMRGPVGSDIEITVRRRGERKALTFTITREIIEVASVKTEIKDKNVGYIRLTSFNENSSDQIKKKLSEFKKNKNIEKYILDLRNNPGGLLSQAIKISDFFLENGEIVSTKSRKNSENRKWFAKKGDIINGDTILVLINYGSASASEIVAGALKDHKRAILIGEATYGKGSVQSIIPLDNKGAIRLTVSKYYLPSGDSISDVGVVPDFEVAEENDSFRINTETDNQLDFALKLLNG